jgi:hypothetical protein
MKALSDPSKVKILKMRPHQSMGTYETQAALKVSP